MDVDRELIGFYDEGCVRAAARSWLSEIAASQGRVWLSGDERENMLLCIAECLSRGYFDEVAQFWIGTSCLCDAGYWREWEQIERQCLDASRAVGDVKRQADILGGLSWLAFQKDQLDEAAEQADTALRLYTQLPDPVGSLRARRYVAMISFKRKDYTLAQAQAKSLLNDIVAARPTIAEQDQRQTLRWQEAYAHGLLSDVLRELGDDSGAEDEAMLMLKWARLGIGITTEHLLNLGKLRIRQGRGDEAGELFRECLEVCRAEDVPLTAADALEQWADVARLQGDRKSAFDRAQAALQIYHHLGVAASERRVAELLQELGLSVSA